jgi:hypothetical protein
MRKHTKELNWDELNDLILEVSEEDALEMLAEELATKRRKGYLKRIHSRINRLRNEREKKELYATSSSGLRNTADPEKA